MPMSVIFSESQQLPHIPKVVQELIESFRDENADFDAISAKVALDQTLTAKVLRLANSAHYGVSRTIASTQDAVMLLGFDTLRTMVLASGLTGAFKAPEDFDIQQFWKNAFAIAALSKWLAKYTEDVDPETAFTCGMLHSIGQLLIQLVKPAEAKSISEAEELGGKRFSLEENMLGFTSEEVGAELAKRWKFPDEMQEAIEQQNNPEKDLSYTELAGIIYIARYLKQSHDDNISEEDIIAQFPLDVAQVIGLNTEQAYSDLATASDLHSGLDSLLES